MSAAWRSRELPTGSEVEREHHRDDPPQTLDEWSSEVRRLARERDAVILAHNYQLPEIQDVADHVGDSLALSRIAAASDASTIVFAGVYFMAETAKILAPERPCSIPEPRAGCSLADSIDADAAARSGRPSTLVPWWSPT